MATRPICSGSQGKYERRFVREYRGYVVWGDLSVCPSILPNRGSLAYSSTRSHKNILSCHIPQILFRVPVANTSWRICL